MSIFVDMLREIDLIALDISALDSFAADKGDMNMSTARHLVSLIQADLKHHQTNLLRATKQLQDNHAKNELVKKENQTTAARVKKALELLGSAGDMAISASMTTKDESLVKYASGAAVQIGAAKRALRGAEIIL